MIAWIVYIIVFFILLFVLYLGFIGVKIGLKAKNNNKIIKIKHNNKSSKHVSIKKKKNLYND